MTTRRYLLDPVDDCIWDSQEEEVQDDEKLQRDENIQEDFIQDQKQAEENEEKNEPNRNNSSSAQALIGILTATNDQLEKEKESVLDFLDMDPNNLSNNDLKTLVSTLFDRSRKVEALKEKTIQILNKRLR